jgi:hypothetical protein
VVVVVGTNKALVVMPLAVAAGQEDFAQEQV